MSRPNDAERPAMFGRLGAQFDELTGLLAAARSGPVSTERVVAFAAQAVPHAEDCGLTVVRGTRRPRTAAAAGQLAPRVDVLQYEAGEGPCLEASETDDLVLVADLADDDRWPVFASRCVAETGVHSMFSLRLALAGEDRAALNFYAHTPDAFDDLDVGVGAIFASYAALAVQAALNEEHVAHLETALRTSRQIGTAVGILMARELITAEQAFAQLMAASQHLNRKLRDIADEVARTGTLPEGARGAVPRTSGHRPSGRSADRER